jgi:hypothetical protein
MEASINFVYSLFDTTDKLVYSQRTTHTIRESNPVIALNYFELSLPYFYF